MPLKGVWARALWVLFWSLLREEAKPGLVTCWPPATRTCLDWKPLKLLCLFCCLSVLSLVESSIGIITALTTLLLAPLPPSTPVVYSLERLLDLVCPACACTLSGSLYKLRPLLLLVSRVLIPSQFSEQPWNITILEPILLKWYHHVLQTTPTNRWSK
uniref:Uncharacterized protein n=1 Tax=Cladonia peziziformis TaxID=184108 RepID=A0A345D2Y6_9LECA|nr:hypothetical protein [Cladonia peziziformis]AXF80700.1 hypothetical protein [Cladonia peziziformis]